MLDADTWVFGNSETRQLADFRRSGTVEALAGGIAATTLSAKMANSISASTRLQKTYSPVMLAAVREADKARLAGRSKLREVGPAVRGAARHRKRGNGECIES